MARPIQPGDFTQSDENPNILYKILSIKNVSGGVEIDVVSVPGQIGKSETIELTLSGSRFKGSNTISKFNYYRPDNLPPQFLTQINPLLVTSSTESTIDPLPQGITGTKDTDMELLLRMDDETLASTCQTNRYISELCRDEQFWKRRSQRIFSGKYTMVKEFFPGLSERDLYQRIKKYGYFDMELWELIIKKYPTDEDIQTFLQEQGINVIPIDTRFEEGSFEAFFNGVRNVNPYIVYMYIKHRDNPPDKDAFEEYIEQSGMTELLEDYEFSMDELTEKKDDAINMLNWLYDNGAINDSSEYSLAVSIYNSMDEDLLKWLSNHYLETPYEHIEEDLSDRVSSGDPQAVEQMKYANDHYGIFDIDSYFLSNLLEEAYVAKNDGVINYIKDTGYRVDLDKLSDINMCHYMSTLNPWDINYYLSTGENSASNILNRASKAECDYIIKYIKDNRYKVDLKRLGPSELHYFMSTFDPSERDSKSELWQFYFGSETVQQLKENLQSDADNALDRGDVKKLEELRILGVNPSNSRIDSLKSRLKRVAPLDAIQWLADNKLL